MCRKNPQHLCRRWEVKILERTSLGYASVKATVHCKVQADILKKKKSSTKTSQLKTPTELRVT